MPVLDLAAMTAPSTDMLSRAGNGLGASTVDASIPANIMRPSAPLVSGGTPPPGNPLGTLNDLTGIQQKQAEIAATRAGMVNTQNANVLFQAQQKARVKAGQILSSAPDVESGIKGLLSDPEVAPFAGDIITSIRGAQQTLVSTQGEQQKQGQSAVQAFASSLAPLMHNPTEKSWNAIAGAAAASASPAGREALQEALPNIKSYLFDDLPKGPQGEMEFHNRLTGLMVGAGLADSFSKNMLGTNETVDAGGTKRFITRAPVQMGGGVTETGHVDMSLPPTVATGPGSVPLVLGGGGGAIRAGGAGVPGAGSMGMESPLHAPGSQNSLGGTAPVPMAQRRAQAQPAAQPSSPQITRQTAGNSAWLPSSEGQAGDGKPLIPAGANMSSPSVGKGAGGLNLLSATQLDSAKTLQDDFAGPGLKAYNNAQTTLGLLTEMDRDFDEMAKGGGFLVPGAAAKFRVSLGKYGNLLSSMTDDKKPLFDPSKIASAESLMKDTRRMGLTVLTTMLGNQREAAQTISNITQAVPDIDNTYLGGKLLISSIGALTQRSIDQRNWENAWQANPKNQGNLMGADEAFQKYHPASDYVTKVLDQFGIGKNGDFKSPQAVIDAVKQRLLTKDQASKILHDQFPNQK